MNGGCLVFRLVFLIGLIDVVAVRHGEPPQQQGVVLVYLVVWNACVTGV